MAIFAVAVVLAGALFYFGHGSFERYPTDEQQGKVRVVMALVVASACLAELLLFWLLKRIRRAG